jgi:hypothetical protein
MDAKPLFSVITEYDLLYVEDYQRTYAWTKDEIDEFFSDLKETAASGETHFFGTLILQSDGEKTASVVDGQQRLTTSYITVAAFRDAVSKLGSDRIVEPGRIPVHVASQSWEFLVANGDPSTPRFISNRFIKPLFFDHVIPLPDDQIVIPERGNPLTLNFRKAVKHIRELVRAELENIEGPDAKLRYVHLLQESLLKKFLVLHVSTRSMNESLEIFLTLNNRGVALGPSDLVRGEVMSARSIGLTEPQQKALHGQIFEEWSTISENVEDPETFLRHYLVATDVHKVTKKKVVEFVSKRIKNPSGDRSPALAEEFWSDLIAASHQYQRIISPGTTTDSGYHLTALHGFTKSHRIFMIGLYRSSATQSEFDEAVRLLYVLCFRYHMAGLNAQQLEDFFQLRCNDMRNGEPTSYVLTLLKEKIASIEFNVHRYLKNEGDSGFIGKAILHAINRREAPHADNANTISGKIHLEHIAPQTATDAWKAELFSGNSTLYDEYESVISSIGNLSLLDSRLNIEAQQKPKSEKNDIYGDSNYKITRDLTSNPNWRQEHVENRTDWVAEMFEHIWSVEPKLSEVVPYPTWSGYLA